ncbi:hypothetical protein Tco_0284763 [Tanacetum coccineum]
MAALKFAKTYNLDAFLEKPDESDGFEQIVDFLNAHTIKYALMINPTIYTSCIEQFWATAKVKTINEEKQLQALVDRKKVVITESRIRRDLQLEDAKGMDCLPTATIFEELTRIGYEKLTQKLTFYKAFFSPQWKFFIHTVLQCLSAKTTAWNEFSNTMASAIICLATNQKFNFSTYIFYNMVKNLEGGVKFLMYPRFIQVFVNQQLGDMSHHKKIFVNPSHTKKVFRNMKKEGKGFSGRVTPLFPTKMKKQPRRKQRKDTEVPQPSGPKEPVADETKNVESVPTHSNDLLLSGEDSIKLNELMELCTILQSRVLALETTKTNQALEIDSLQRRVKKLEKKKRPRTHGLKILYKVGLTAKVISSDDESLGDQEDVSKQWRIIDNIDVDEGVTLVDETQGRNDEEMFDTGILDGEEVFAEQDMAEKEVSVVDPVTTAGEVVTTVSTAATITPEEVTLDQALGEIKTSKPKAKGIVFKEPSESTTTTPTPIVTPQQSSQVKDKGKGKMVEPEPVKKFSKKEQIRLDEEVARNLQAQLQVEEERITREKQEANVALIEEWNDIQAKIKADQLLAERLQAREQEELTIKERVKLFQQLLKKRRKFFAAKRAEEKRNGPPTKAQQMSIMCTYLKNMARWKAKDLKNKSFATIQGLFDKAMKRVNTFVDMDTELVEGSKKRAEDSTKRAGTKLEQEVAKKQKIDDAKVDDDQEEAEMKKLMEIVLDEEEVTVDAIPLATKPPSILSMGQQGQRRDMRVLWGDLMTMFEPDVESPVWRTLQDEKVLIWKLFDSCGVHFLRLQSMHIFMLGRIVGIKRLHDDLGVDTAKVRVTAVKHKLVLVNVVDTKLQLLKDYNCKWIKIA